MAIRLALAQFAPEKGQRDRNIQSIARHTRQGLDLGADLIAFPESAVTGYLLQDGAREQAISASELAAEVQTALGPIEKEIDLLIGFYESNDGQPFNSAAYLEAGRGGVRVVSVYRKFFLPTYGVFDEDRFHARGRDIGVFDTRLGRIGVLICEDVWHSILGTLAAMSGAQLLLVPSASPVRGVAQSKPGNQLRYERMLRAMAEEHGMYTAASMLVGFEGGKGFSGGSMLYDPFGELVVQAPSLDESLVVGDLDFEMVRLARAKTPLLNDLNSSWSRIAELVRSALENENPPSSS